MNENNEEYIPPEQTRTEEPVPVELLEATPPEAAKRKRISRWVWIAGCGSLLILFCAVLAVVFVNFGLPLFGGDTIASAVPADSAMYMSFDLVKTQSQEVADIVSIAQEMADGDKNETLTDSLDKFMNDELGMSFAEDVAPWIGRHGALVLTDLNMSDETFEMMFILEARDKKKADEFVGKFVTALEDKQGMEFAKNEENGVTFYIDEANSSYDQDMVIARSGKLVYVSNSRQAVSQSIGLEKKDSLAKLNGYQDLLGSLSRDRIATMYMSGDAYSEAMSSAWNSAYGFNAPYLQGLASEGLTGIALGLSVDEHGLRTDMAIAYDESKINDYQREVLSTEYLAPTTDALVPENTFLFVAANTPRAPSSYTKIDNPLYSSDVTEAFDLFEQQYGINVRELVDILGGEFAFAVGPASDGLFVQTGNVNMGFTVLAGTSDEQRFNDWFESLLNTMFEQDPYTTYDVNDTNIGQYQLKELSIQDGPNSVTALVYGADNGFIILGSSPDMLEKGFTSDKTLRDNETYRQTWDAFPGDSVPYVYLNLGELMNFLADNAENFGSPELRDNQQKLSQIPVVAISLNKSNGYVRSATMIIFIDKNK